MLFYDDMLALQGSGYYDTYDDDWENDDDDDWGDSGTKVCKSPKKRAVTMR